MTSMRNLINRELTALRLLPGWFWLMVGICLLLSLLTGCQSGGGRPLDFSERSSSDAATVGQGVWSVVNTFLGVYQQAITEINLDNAGPMNVDKRRKLYQEPIKAWRKVVDQAFDRLSAGMVQNIPMQRAQLQRQALEGSRKAPDTF